MYYNETIQAVHDSIIAEKQRSAWNKGVSVYATELLENIDIALRNGDLNNITDRKALERIALNGANDWSHYSWSGCALCYNGDIAERLCAPSELKKNRHGDRRPNNSEEWLDVQACALYQAFNRIKRHIRKITRG